MLNQKLFDDVSSRIAELLANSPAKDIEKNLRAMIASAFARLDLVTREEFEVQAALLSSCQERLAALEARVAQCEASARNPADC